MRIEEKIILIADSHCGRFIPQMITNNELKNPLWDWSNVSSEDIKSLKEGPENEWYWDAWYNAMNNIAITFEGYSYILMYNEDLMAVREDVTEEEMENWII